MPNIYLGPFDYVLIVILIVSNILFWKKNSGENTGCLAACVFGLLLPLLSIIAEIELTTGGKKVMDNFELLYTFLRFPVYWGIGILQAFVLYLKPNFRENAVYYDEDMFCMVEILPRENIFHLKGENEKITKFSEIHHAEYGYHDTYQIKKIPITIAERQITIENFDTFLNTVGFIKAEKVYYGYGSEKRIAASSHAYNFQGAQVFIEFKANIVVTLWINGFRFHTDELIKSNLKTALHAIGREFDLILNDYNLSLTIDLLNIEDIEQYLNEDL